MEDPRVRHTEFLLETGLVPSDDALLASTVMFVVISMFSAWLCARFAPGRGDRHVLWFFILGQVTGIAAAIPNWSKGWPLVVLAALLAH